MTRKEAKELLPIIQAFAEGKEIQIKINESKWETIENCTFTSSSTFYRIKAEPKYRPFKSRDECWNEMSKHQPFGWLKPKTHEENVLIGAISDERTVTLAIEANTEYAVTYIFENYTFADGTPFGIKEE